MRPYDGPLNERTGAAGVPAIALAGVEKTFDADRREAVPFTALRGLDLEVMPGELFCLLGPSGCGKTTLLNMVAGFEPPTAGSVGIFGEPVSSPGADRGVIFQSDRALFDWMTVEENVSFGPRMRAVPSADRRRSVEEQLRLVGLAEHRGKLPRELSGGMKQRVQIARVLANDPGILLMDEPFAALDAYTRSRMQHELADIWARTRRTILFVTHDISEALWLADRIGIMTRGPESRVKDVIDVHLPRPRQRMTPDFIDLFNLLNEAIESEAGGDTAVVSSDGDVGPDATAFHGAA